MTVRAPARTPRTPLALCASLVLALAGACSDDDDDPADADANVANEIAEGNRRGTEVAARIAAMMGPMDAADELRVSAAIMATVDQGEILHAELALDRARDPEVAAFARRMYDEHGAHLALTTDRMDERTLEPLPNEISAALQVEAGEAATQLQAAPDDTFDAVYLRMQVQMHAEARHVAGALAEQVSDPAFADFYAQTRATIEGHLDDAIALTAEIDPP